LLLLRRRSFLLRRGRLFRMGAKCGSKNGDGDAAENTRTKHMRARQPKQRQARHPRPKYLECFKK
jgi:hypothetical protein